MVGLMVGALLGPLIGWFIGTFATFFTSTLVTDSTRGLRISAFVGGLVGIPFGLITGVIVATPIRIAFSIFSYNRPRPRLAATLGGLLGFGSGYLIHQFWNPSEVSFLYLTIHSVAVGGVTAAVAAAAKPKWLDSDPRMLPVSSDSREL
jgi:hypothetical protein